ncbi:Nitrous oxide reductase maturation protein NosF (ATPase) [hydrothermal vent metagenome]|uniref:Nitrous oxide reductase maturation protein NosF (ATPase) n=1 Tax=hydrothermal vent metagenome TaxID=652676 RepID=A0A3B1C9K0_9ZZZZ
MIVIKDLHKKFGKVTVLNGINLNFKDKGIHTILGPNGSGKTTLIKSILGMVIPNHGSIEFSGEKILGKWQYRNKISYLPQIANFPQNLKVKELFKMINDLRPGAKNESELISTFQLEPYLNKKLGNLSGGTAQKVNIVITFMYDSPLIILDEPTVGLDPVALIRLKKLIYKEKEKGKTILITTHIMSLVEEISDEIVFLLDGKIYFKGTIDQLKQQTNQDNLENAIANILEGSYA